METLQFLLLIILKIFLFTKAQRLRITKSFALNSPTFMLESPNSLICWSHSNVYYFRKDFDRLSDEPYPSVFNGQGFRLTNKGEVLKFLSNDFLASQSSETLSTLVLFNEKVGVYNVITLSNSYSPTKVFISAISESFVIVSFQNDSLAYLNVLNVYNPSVSTKKTLSYLVINLCCRYNKVLELIVCLFRIRENRNIYYQLFSPIDLSEQTDKIILTNHNNYPSSSKIYNLDSHKKMVALSKVSDLIYVVVVDVVNIPTKKWIPIGTICLSKSWFSSSSLYYEVNDFYNSIFYVIVNLGGNTSDYFAITYDAVWMTDNSYNTINNGVTVNFQFLGSDEEVGFIVKKTDTEGYIYNFRLPKCMDVSLVRAPNIITVWGIDDWSSDDNISTRNSLKLNFFLHSTEAYGATYTPINNGARETNINFNPSNQYTHLEIAPGDTKGSYTIQYFLISTYFLDNPSLDINNYKYVGNICNITLNITCFERCKKCTGWGNEASQLCTECEDKYLLWGDSCLEECPTGYFAWNNKCNSCYATCATCSQNFPSSNHQCITCLPNWFKRSDTGDNCLPIPTPDEGYYLDTSITPPIYDKCYQTCKSCHRSGNSTIHNCDVCGNQRYFFEDDNMNCKLLESDGYYLKNSTTYARCYDTCKTCWDQGSDKNHNCNTCSDNLSFREDTGKNCLVSPGNNYYYYNSYSNTYMKCGESCLTCNQGPTNGDHNCLTCIQDLYFRDDNNTCFEIPLEKYYFDNIDKIYKKCYQTCQTCRLSGSQSSHNCDKCLSNYAKFEDIDPINNCIALSDQSTANYYYNLTHGQYMRCYSTCSTCNGYGDSMFHNCNNCNSGFKPLQVNNGNCYSSPPEGYYDSGNNYVKCNEACKTCIQSSNLSNTNCGLCNTDLGYFPIASERSSYYDNIRQCYKGNITHYFFDDDNKEYKDCDSSCLYCFNTPSLGKTNCFSCDLSTNRFPLIHDYTQCYNKDVIYDQIFYDDTNKRFDYCYETCRRCTMKGTHENNSCYSCNNNFFLISGSQTCTTAPTPRYYWSNNILFPCYQGCLTCTSGGSNSCIDCDTENNYYKAEGIQNQCFENVITTTVPEHFFSPDKQMWVKCYFSCSQCIGEGDINEHNCKSCGNWYYPLSNHQSVCRSLTVDPPVNYYFDITYLMFYPCYESCEKCTALGTWVDHKCLKCKDNYYPLFPDWNNCYTEFSKPYGTYIDENDQMIKQCDSLCTECTKESTNCIWCSSGNILLSDLECFDTTRVEEGNVIKTDKTAEWINENFYNFCFLNIKFPINAVNFVSVQGSDYWYTIYKHNEQIPDYNPDSSTKINYDKIKIPDLCIKTLKERYLASEIYIAQWAWYPNGSESNTITNKLNYKIFTDKCVECDISLCHEDIIIEEYYINADYDFTWYNDVLLRYSSNIFETSDKIYNDRCLPFYSESDDKYLTLYNRRNSIYPQISLCEPSCSLINITNYQQVFCSCLNRDVKYEMIRTKEIPEEFMNINNSNNNMYLFTCLKEAFQGDILWNAGLYLTITMFVLNTLSIIFSKTKWFFTPSCPIKKQGTITSSGSNSSWKKTNNVAYNKDATFNKGWSKVNLSSHRHFINNQNGIVIYDQNKKEKVCPDRKDIIIDKIPWTTTPTNLKFTPLELNYLPFYIARKKDTRKFDTYIKSLLKTRLLFLPLFYNFSLFYSIPLKLINVLYTIICFFTSLVILINEDIISNLYMKRKESLGIGYIMKHHLGLCFIAALISMVLTKFNKLFLLFEGKWAVGLKLDTKMFKNVIRENHMQMKWAQSIAICGIVVLELLGCILIFAFCGLYNNIQIHWIIYALIVYFFWLILTITWVLLESCARWYGLTDNHRTVFLISIGIRYLY